MADVLRQLKTPLKDAALQKTMPLGQESWNCYEACVFKKPRAMPRRKGTRRVERRP